MQAACKTLKGPGCAAASALRVPHLAQQHRYHGHNCKRAEGPREHEGLWLLQCEQQCNEERLVADLREKDQQEARDNALPQRGVANNACGECSQPSGR